MQYTYGRVNSIVSCKWSFQNLFHPDVWFQVRTPLTLLEWRSAASDQVGSIYILRNNNNDNNNNNNDNNNNDYNDTDNNNDN